MLHALVKHYNCAIAQGVMLVRGPGVMKGYFADEAATTKAFVGDGWFDTGDLGWRAPSAPPTPLSKGNCALREIYFHPYRVSMGSLHAQDGSCDTVSGL